MQAQQNLTTSLSWDELEGVHLDPKILEILKENDFMKTTPVQVHTLPLFLSHKDVAVQACTGSGKTLAFAIPLVQILLRALANDTVFLPTQIAALVITPIRELAKQVKEVIELFASPMGLKTVLLIGGSSPEEDQEIFADHRRNPSRGLIVVGTPGKLESSIYHSTPQLFNVRQLEVLIMDEADSLLEMGFEASLNRILTKLPKQRRTGLFSATQTKELRQLIRAGLRNPVQINVKVNSSAEGNDTNQEQVIPVSLQNYYSVIPVQDKLAQLAHLVTSNAEKKIICYFLTCAQAFVAANIQLYSLHGKVPHNKRKGIYENFIQKESGVLFTTDVAARGLDFPDVDWVVQFDAPQHPDQFVHRIGRTARMGKAGNAVVFLSSTELDYVELLRHKTIPIEEMESFKDVDDIFPYIKGQAIKEREVFEKAQLAFVSFVRAYKEHACSYIFRLSRLDLGNLANGFGLLTLPKMPELLNPAKIINFQQDPVDTNTIKFKDKNREKSRQRKMKQLRAKQALRAAQQKPVKVIKKSDSWSAKKRQVALKSGFDVKASVDAQEEEDWNDDYRDLQQETKLRKRLRKGKITQHNFNKEMNTLNALSDIQKFCANIPAADQLE